MEKHNIDPAELVKGNNVGDTDPKETADLSSLTDAQKLQKHLDLMSPEQLRALARRKQKKKG